MKRLIVSTCLAAALLSGAAMAQTAPGAAPTTPQNGGQTAPGTANTQPGVQPQTGAGIAAGQQSNVGPLNPTPGATAPLADTTAATVARSTPADLASTNLQDGANSFTESQTKARLEKAGFSAVENLKKDDRGIWRGQAMRDGKSMAVAVDFKGNIAAQ